MHPQRSLKRLLIFLTAVVMSAAYLVSAFQKIGTWGVPLFVLIWGAVFWYEYRRSKRSGALRHENGESVRGSGLSEKPNEVSQNETGRGRR